MRATTESENTRVAAGVAPVVAVLDAAGTVANGLEERLPNFESSNRGTRITATPHR